MKWSFLPCLIFSVFFGSCGHLFFQPSSVLYSHPSQMGIDAQDFYIAVTPEIRLHAQHLKVDATQKVRGTIVQFHGNAENLSSHYRSLAWLVEHGYELFVFDYRGYGKSQGRSNFENAYQDGLKVLEIIERKRNQDGPLILFGQSLGGAILQKVLAERSDHQSVSLIVLDSTFSSYRQAAASALASHWLTYLFSPLGHVLVSDRHSGKDLFFQRVKKPLLVIHSENDPVVNYRLGAEIAKRYLGAKDLWSFETPSHIGVFFVEDLKYRDQFINYLEQFH